MEAAYRKEADCMIVPMPREVDHHEQGNRSVGGKLACSQDCI